MFEAAGQARCLILRYPFYYQHQEPSLLQPHLTCSDPGSPTTSVRGMGLVTGLPDASVKLWPRSSRSIRSFGRVSHSCRQWQGMPDCVRMQGLQQQVPINGPLFDAGSLSRALSRHTPALLVPQQPSPLSCFLSAAPSVLLPQCCSQPPVSHSCLHMEVWTIWRAVKFSCVAGIRSCQMSHTSASSIACSRLSTSCSCTATVRYTLRPSCPACKYRRGHKAFE
jgi:hypothetical protein